MTLARLNTLTLTLLLMIGTGFNPANATLITSNGFTLDSTTNIVTENETGIEWLQWDVTVGLSINQALEELADGMFDGADYGTGWTLATNVQVAGLFDAFGFNSTISETSEEVTEFPFTPTEDGQSPDFFIDLFGSTFTRDGESGTGEGVLAEELTAAFFGSDENTNELFNVGIIRSDFTVDETLVGGQVEQLTFSAQARQLADVASADDSNNQVGIALVRLASAPDNQIEVPEPSTIAILTLGLLGLGLRRRPDA